MLLSVSPDLTTCTTDGATNPPRGGEEVGFTAAVRICGVALGERAGGGYEAELGAG